MSLSYVCVCVRVCGYILKNNQKEILKFIIYWIINCIGFLVIKKYTSKANAMEQGEAKKIFMLKYVFFDFFSIKGLK